MNKLLIAAVVSFPLIFGAQEQIENNYSTTSVVTVVGGIILGKDSDKIEKYKREDCPVCEGKGWYMSGDGIKKIQCQYCEE
jgi:hypothetical protein